jgi:4-amino-4-deoxy-L-arabinose transferase-like glycosyltransferase
MARVAQEQASWRRDAIGLAGLLGLAAAIRVLAWSRTTVLFNDGPVLLSIAQAMGEGRWDEVFAHPFHPLYPLSVWLLGQGSLDPEVAGVVVSIAGGLLSIAALHVFWRTLFDRQVAWLGAWVVALHPSAVDFSSDVMSDGLYVGLYLAGLAALARAVMRPALRPALLAGVFSGLAYWVRPEGVGLLIVALVLLGLRAMRDGAERRRWLGALAGLLLVGVLLASVYVAVVESRTGEAALTRKKSIRGLVTGGAALPSSVLETPERRIAAGAEASTVLLPELAVRADGPGTRRPPRSLLGFAEANLRVLRTASAAIRYELLPFVLLGLLALRGRESPWCRGVIVAPTLLYFGVLVLLVWGAGYVSRRHTLALVLPWIGHAAVGWRWAAGRLASKAPRWGDRVAAAGAPRWMVLALVMLLVVAWLPRDLRVRRGDRAAVRAAAEWLAEVHPDSGAVAAQKLRVAYYARAPFVPLPPGTDGQLRAILEQRGARWVVIDQAKLGDHTGLAEGLGGWLRPLHRIERAGHTALVLEVTPRAAG